MNNCVASILNSVYMLCRLGLARAMTSWCCTRTFKEVAQTTHYEPLLRISYCRSVKYFFPDIKK